MVVVFTVVSFFYLCGRGYLWAAAKCEKVEAMDEGCVFFACFRSKSWIHSLVVSDTRDKSLFREFRSFG